MRTGIEERATDKRQPFRVWYLGTIVYFAKTRLAAEFVLMDEGFLTGIRFIPNTPLPMSRLKRVNDK